MKKAGKAAGGAKGKAGPAPKKAGAEPAAKKAGAPPQPNEVEHLFEQFASLQEMCNQIGVDPATDVAVLVLAWKCRTRTMGTITKEEFIRGMAELHADNLNSLRNRTSDMRDMVRDVTTAQFKGTRDTDFFRFVFEISREPGSKVLDLEVAQALMDMLLSPTYALARKFKAFLGIKEGLRALSVDQWLSFLEFCKQHSRSLSNYDSDGACNMHAGPVLIDEFVGWLQAGN